MAFCDEQIDIFVAKNMKVTHQHLDEDEEIQVEAWEVKDLLDLIYRGEMKDSKTVSGILAYAIKEGITYAQ